MNIIYLLNDVLVNNGSHDSGLIKLYHLATSSLCEYTQQSLVESSQGESLFVCVCVCVSVCVCVCVCVGYPTQGLTHALYCCSSRE
jgi:hypothetical protein